MNPTVVRRKSNKCSINAAVASIIEEMSLGPGKHQRYHTIPTVEVLKTFLYFLNGYETMQRAIIQLYFT